MAVVLGILSVASLVYGIAMGLTYPAGGFFLIWVLLGAALAAVAWTLRAGRWGLLPIPVRAAIVGAFILFTLFVGVGCGFVLSAASASAPADLDYIVVLGASLNDDGTPKKTLQLRLDAAIDYLDASPSTRCIVSGGQGGDEPQTEASAMAKYLEDAGIDSARITLEEKSTSTAENLEFSRRLISSKAACVGVVTNNFHVYRALGIARKQGFSNVWGISAPTEIQYLPQATLRECFAIAKDAIRGNI